MPSSRAWRSFPAAGTTCSVIHTPPCSMPFGPDTFLSFAPIATVPWTLFFTVTISLCTTKLTPPHEALTVSWSSYVLHAFAPRVVDHSRRRGFLCAGRDLYVSPPGRIRSHADALQGPHPRPFAGCRRRGRTHLRERRIEG